VVNPQTAQTRPLLEEIRSRCHPHVASDVLTTVAHPLQFRVVAVATLLCIPKVGPDGGLPVVQHCPWDSPTGLAFTAIFQTQRGDV